MKENGSQSQIPSPDLPTYGAARVSYVIAKDGELPEVLEHKVWRRPIEGLLLTAVAAVLMANLFNLSSISTMGSAGFLLVFAAVNVANMRLRERTSSRGWLSALGAVACFGALGALVWQRLQVTPAQLLILGAMVAIALAVEPASRSLSGRRHRPHFPLG